MTAEHRVCATLLTLVVVLLLGCGGESQDNASTPAATETAPKTETSPARGPRLGTAFGSMSSLPGILDGGPPWPANNAKLQLRLRAIGLDPLTAEGQVVHIHQHLDVYVAGKKVTVPGQVGIGPQDTFISDLHTHDESGIMHVESPTQRDFSLGQFFAVWGLPLGEGCVANLCEAGPRQLRVWVNGKPVDADPTRIVLAEHQQIVLAYGTVAQVPEPVPASYDFAKAGL